MSNSYIKNFLIEKKTNSQQEMTLLLLPMFNNWKGGIVIIFSIEEFGRVVYPKGRNKNSGIEARLAIEEIGRGVHPMGRNWNSGFVTKFTIEKLERGVAVRNSFWKCTKYISSIGLDAIELNHFVLMSWGFTFWPNTFQLSEGLRECVFAGFVKQKNYCTRYIYFLWI